MIIKKNKNNKRLGNEAEGFSEYVEDEQTSDITEQFGENAVAEAQEDVPVEDQEINLFDLDNIDFKQRQERRRGDRRRGFRRIDDRNLISRAKEEAFAIKEAAQKEGYQAGLDEIHAEFDEIKEAVKVFYNAPQQVYDSVAPDILEISLDIAKKIIKKEVIENQDIVLDNIRDILKGLSKEETKLTLRVNPSQAAMLKQEVPEITTSLGLEVKLYIVPDEGIMPGGCVVTTSNGVIDATIEAQLSVISEVMKEI